MYNAASNARMIARLETPVAALGRAVSGCAALMVLATCAVVMLRYGFDIGIVALQEAITYMHGAIFMLGSAYALQRGAHVRVDIFYRRFSARGQAWVNLLGAVCFLVPVCVYLLWSSLDYVAQSWAIRERSPEAGGIPAVFLFKSMIPLLALSLLLQGIADVLRCGAVLRTPPRP